MAPYVAPRRRADLVRRFLFITAAILVAFAATLPYKRTEEIDATTGRLRRCTHYGPVSVHCKMIETEFSAALDRLRHRLGPPRWQITHSYTFWNKISPHYRYHGVPNGLNMLFVIAENDGWSQVEIDENIMIAADILRDGDQRALNSYLSGLE
jgi:hypothetical protein